MSESHLAYLNLGSNIQPETNLPKAVDLLSKFGEIKNIKRLGIGSSRHKGVELLECLPAVPVQFQTRRIEGKVIHPSEAQLGRKRSKG